MTSPEPVDGAAPRHWSERPFGDGWVEVYLSGLAIVALLLAMLGVRLDETAHERPVAANGSTGQPAPPKRTPTTPEAPDVVPTGLPGGAVRIFEPGRTLVAYYGTAGTGSLGVLGEEPPEKIMPRLTRAAADFAGPGRTVQPVFELIATVVHGGPGKDGDFNGDIPKEDVRRYIEAAHRHGVLVVLDLQPGRADFLEVAKRWEWALKDPWVGLALDPEWRMGPNEVPAQVIGSVTAAEVNRVSRWLEDLTVANDLPEKVFVLHQFRNSMIRNIDNVRARPHLAMVQHVDGYGPPQAKLATFHAVARPDLFTLGFKLFYDEDRPRMTAERVLRIRPQVRFVSFQ